MNSSNNELILGIDGGGSKCKAVLMRGENILGEGIAGPGNPLHGFEQATTNIVKSAKLALQAANIDESELSNIVAGIGLAGVNLPVLFDQIEHWQHPFKDMYLATDLLVACLGAHQGHDGAVMITGTGSCGFSYIDGKAHMLGAHGFPHGDKGSGAWFGLQAVEQALEATDGLVQETALTPKLFDLLKIKDATELVEAVAKKPATFFAQLANLVFDAAEEGDQIALSIVDEGSQYINKLAESLLKDKPPRLSLIGGLTPRIKPWLANNIQAVLEEPLQPPEIGSVIYARQQLALNN
ncbi:N-acetylglucosamine kinase [Thalassotalea agarivorans]|nr:BadF/BadG/BcrA/BcrD ATPase family protein [Thalassotalea agarivorans]